MTLPAVIRIFFAIDLPTPTKEAIGRYIGLLKKKSKSNAIRWSRPENLHITLQFLAEVKSEDLPKLLEKVRDKLTVSLKNCPIQFGGLQLFPNPFRPRVIVLEIAPQEELAMLSRLIGEGVTAAAYEIENRPFRAHLTLGRIKQPHGLNLNFISEAELPNIEVVEIAEVVLFRSEPQPEGSQYSVIEKIKFGSFADANRIASGP